MADAPSARPESEQERIDRNLGELLGELRVALPGVQVLFAFLLVVPFNQRYEELSSFGETIYFVTLLSTTVAAVLLIAPTVHHRLRFRKQEKEWIVLTGNRLVVVGLGFLALAMTGAILLITDFVFRDAAATLATAGVAAAFLVFWYGIPLRRRAR